MPAKDAKRTGSRCARQRVLERGSFSRDKESTSMRVLVIEDEMQLARHITRALFRTGHEASAVHDGAEGLRAALEIGRAHV